MIAKRTKFIGDLIPGLILACLVNLVLVSTVPAGPVTVDIKSLSAPAADPFVDFVSVGPKHEYEPIYRVPEPGTCAILAYRVLIQSYAHYDNLVVEELGFSGSKCQDIKVNSSHSVNGVTLGYALGEGTRFAWNLEFKGWEAWDTFVISSAKKDFRFRLNRDGQISAEPAQAAADPENSSR